MNTMTITIDVSDWRDVPFDDDERRAKVLRAIADAAERAADSKADDLDIVVKVSVEPN